MTHPAAVDTIQSRKDRIVERLVAALPPRTWVNLGVGMPTLALSHLRERPDVLVHTENGGVGVRRLDVDEDWDGVSVDPSKAPMSMPPGSAALDSLSAFRLIHSGRLGLSVMGAYQVSAGGDLANWSRPGSDIAGIGGAADLVIGSRNVWVTMLQTDPDGNSRLVPECSIPRTGLGVVTRIFTDLGTFTPAGDAFDVLDLSPGVTLDDAQRRSQVPLRLVEGDDR